MRYLLPEMRQIVLKVWESWPEASVCMPFRVEAFGVVLGAPRWYGRRLCVRCQPFGAFARLVSIGDRLCQPCRALVLLIPLSGWEYSPSCARKHQLPAPLVDRERVALRALRCLLRT